MQHFKLLCMSPLLPPLCITICTTVRKIFDVSQQLNCKKCFLIQKNKNYSCICKSIIITSPIRFNIVLTNIDARLKQRFIKVVATLCNVVLTLSNVVSMPFQRRASTLFQRCATLKIRRRILFYFQRRINVILTLIHNVETMLIRR